VVNAKQIVTMAGEQCWPMALQCVFITAKVQTLKIPTLQVGQVIHVSRHSENSGRCSVEVADFTWVSPSKLARLITRNAEADSSTQE
jgi:hypothetical protein